MSLATCQSQQGDVVKKPTGFLLVDFSPRLMSHCRRSLILAWPAGTACHGLMTSVETASAAQLRTCLQRASSKRTECRTPSMTCTGGFVFERLHISVMGIEFEVVRSKLCFLKESFNSMTNKLRLFKYHPIYVLF